MLDGELDERQARHELSRLRQDGGNLGPGLSRSDWIALARSEGRIERLEGASRHSWEPLPPPAARAWTDDNASLLPLLKF